MAKLARISNHWVASSSIKLFIPGWSVNQPNRVKKPMTDTINIGGEDVPFEVDPNGRIMRVGVPNIIVTDYPPVIINTQYGAGADIETLLEVQEPPTDADLLPLKMVEVIDCVGKNIFIKES